MFFVKITLLISILTLKFLKIKDSSFSIKPLLSNDLILFLFFNLFILLSLIWTQNFQFGIKKIIHLLIQTLTVLSFLFLLSNNSFSQKQIKLIFYSIISITSLMAVFILIFSPYSFENFNIKRNFFLTHVYTGRLLSFVLLILLITKIKSLKKINVFLIIIYSLALTLTAYRTAIIAILISTILFYVFNFIQKREKPGIKVLIFTLSMLAGLFISENLNERLPQNNFTDFSSDLSIISRLNAIEEGLKIWKANPVLGGGFGSFLTTDENNPLRKTLKYPHNIFIETLAELGLLGFLLLLLMLYKSLNSAYREGAFYFSFFIYLLIFSLTSKDLTINFILLIFPFIISRTSGILKNYI